MRFNIFPYKFCTNSRPYWVLFFVFVISNILLVYTLFTRQPERYRSISGWLTLAPHNSTTLPDIQTANFITNDGGALIAQANNNAGNSFQNLVNQVTPETPRVFGFMEMQLCDTDVKRPVGKSGVKLEGGVEIVSIKRRSIPYISGFRKGDILISVNRTPCLTVDDFVRIVSQSKSKKGWLFDVYRGGEFCYMTIENNGVNNFGAR